MLLATLTEIGLKQADGSLRLAETENHSFCDVRMKKPPRDPDVADLAPTDSVLTVYDEEHIITYLRMLDADKEGADWREVAQIVLHINP